MKMTALTQRFQSIIFILLLVVLFIVSAHLSMKYRQQWDVTHNQRYTLSEVSIKLLKQLEEPLEITAYASNDDSIRDAISNMITRYQRYKKNIHLRFIDPYTVPTQTRALGIQINGELVIHYQQRAEHVRRLTEESISYALQRLIRSRVHKVYFLTGHGERAIQGEANHDMGLWGEALQQRGFSIETLDLVKQKLDPKLIDTLVIATPLVELLPEEVLQIHAYVNQGGNLLWMIDAKTPLQGLDPLANQLGFSVNTGMIVDTKNPQFGQQQASMLSLTDYPEHPITKDFSYVTLFPQAYSLNVLPSEEWSVLPLLMTAEHAWSETSEPYNQPVFDEIEDIAGALIFAYSLQRDYKDKKQRIILLGDGDFVSNTFLHNGGNLDLGLNIMNWLVAEEQLLDIPAKPAHDRQLQLPPFISGLVGAVYLIILPFIFILIAILVWARRRKV